MKRAAPVLRSERGQGLVSALLLLAGVLLPLLFLVPLFARVEQAHLTAEQAARDAVRSAVQAPASAEAKAAAEEALARARAASGLPLRLELGGEFRRGGLLRAHVSTSVPLGRLPGVGRIGTIVVHGRASAPLDRYRSLREGGPP